MVYTTAIYLYLNNFGYTPRGVGGQIISGSGGAELQARAGNVCFPPIRGETANGWGTRHVGLKPHVSGGRHGAPSFVGMLTWVARQKSTTPSQRVKLSEMGHPVLGSVDWRTAYGVLRGVVKRFLGHRTWTPDLVSTSWVMSTSQATEMRE
jgi:hypothetical protein